MDCKTKGTGRLVCAVAAGLISLTPLAMAQNATTTTTTTSSSTMMSAAPTQVSGTVLRYYTDRSGYVTAMDVQTANGVQMVTFAPGMAQRIYQAYPVGGTANVWVSNDPMGMSVVGMGTETPATWMAPYHVRAVDLLDSEPYTTVGAKEVTVEGNLRRLITSPTGEVLGLVLDGVKPDMKHGVMSADTMSGTAAANPTSASADMGNGGERVLVQVPREMRHVAPAMNGTERVRPLFRNARVQVVGWPEAPRYGSLTPYSNRIAATAIVINGRAVGAVGFPMMKRGSRDTLLNFDFMGSKAADERHAGTMGYSVYDPSGSMTGTGMMGGTGTTAGTTSTTGTGTP
jgi:hypothetical protein